MVKKISSIFISLLFLSVCIFTGCATNKSAGDDTELIVTNTRAVQQLEDTVTALNEILGRSSERIDSIKQQSESITDSIERLEYLFGQYESEVNKLLGEINEIRSKITTEEQNTNNTNNSSSSNDNS